MRILVVEDDIPLAKFIGKGLEEEHYAVDIVHDGEQARIMVCDWCAGFRSLSINPLKRTSTFFFRMEAAALPNLLQGQIFCAAFTFPSFAM